jgi:tetratricopeptide (TPR) repeat protein
MLKRLPLLIAVLALAVWAGNFIIKNFLAVSLLVYGQPGESSVAAVGYAPANAEVLAARARYLLYRADEPRAEEAIAVLQQATAASPRDYRYWLELGKAYDSNGQRQQAETSLEHAVSLAPRYFEPRWALANSRLRAGKMEAALNDFREAVALSSGGYGNASPHPDRNVTLNAFNTINGALGMNLGALRSVTPSDSAARSYLAEFLATHDALDQALEIWRALPADDPGSYRILAVQLTRELQSKNRFQEAHEVWRKLYDVEGVPADNPNNLIANPGYEQTPLREKYIGVVGLGEGFEWVILRHTEVRAARSTEAAHSGSYGLRLVFTAPMNSAFQEISQLAAVEPSRQYRLSYFAKTRNLSSLPNETPFVEITDAANSSAFSLRSVMPSGTTDWSEQAITFTTTENTRGLRLTIRAPQVKTIDRARIPELWLDDFKLEKITP